MTGCSRGWGIRANRHRPRWPRPGPRARSTRARTAVGRRRALLRSLRPPTCAARARCRRPGRRGVPRPSPAPRRPAPGGPGNRLPELLPIQRYSIGPAGNPCSDRNSGPLPRRPDPAARKRFVCSRRLAAEPRKQSTRGVPMRFFRTRRIGGVLAAVVAGALFLLAGTATAAPAAPAAPAAGAVTAPVTGTFTDANGGTGTFTGTYTIDRFVQDGDAVTSQGTLDGVLTDST